MTDRFVWNMRYATLPVSPAPVVENGLAIAWDIPTTMTHQGVEHTLTERYICAEDEKMLPTDPRVSRLLERAMLALEIERNVLERCADELEAKIAAQTEEPSPSA